MNKWIYSYLGVKNKNKNKIIVIIFLLIRSRQHRNEKERKIRENSFLTFYITNFVIYNWKSFSFSYIINKIKYFAGRFSDNYMYLQHREER